MQKLIPWTITLSTISVVFGYNIRFYLAWQIVGIIAIVNNVKILPVMRPLILLLPISFGAYIINGLSIYNLIKLSQLFLVFKGTSFIALNMTRANIHKSLLFIAILTIFMLILEILFSNDVGWHHLFRIDQLIRLPRYRFMHGENNYSAIFLLALFLISFLEKKTLLSKTFLTLSLLTFSRGIAVSYLVFVFFLFIKKRYSNLTRGLCYVFLSLFLLYPFINMTIYHYAPKNITNFLIKKGSPRHKIHAVYTEYGLKNLLGRGHLNFINFSLEDGPVLKHNPIVNKQDQHSFSVEVLSEFGIVGYFIFCFFIFQFFGNIYKNGKNHAIAFMALLTASFFLNGLSLFHFHIFIAYSYYFSMKECKNKVWP